MPKPTAPTRVKTKPTPSAFGVSLQKFRRMKQYASLRSLADAVECTGEELGQIESGHVQRPNVDLAAKIASVLGCQLLHGKEGAYLELGELRPPTKRKGA
jgi:DNA-binding XRE family transcriptional regulator